MSGNGDCFEVAAKLVLEDRHDELRLVHGLVTAPEFATGKDGQAAPGERHPHAWVEYSEFLHLEHDGEEREFELIFVLDRSNGHDQVLPAGLYYKLGKIGWDDVRCYNRDEARRWMVAEGHYGPWEELR